MSVLCAQGGKAGFVKGLLSCYWGADMTEDESHTPRRNNVGGGSPNSSVHGAGAGRQAPRSQSATAALLCADRTVVRTLGDTVRGLIWPAPSLRTGGPHLPLPSKTAVAKDTRPEGTMCCCWGECILAHPLRLTAKGPPG
jgi:hypothetical protein